MKKVIATIALAIGVMIAPFVSAPIINAGPNEGYASFTDCWQPAAFQSRYVCFDETTPFGPVLYIRNGNGSNGSGSWETSGVGYSSTYFGACRSFADPPEHLIAGALAAEAFVLGGTWPNNTPNGSVCPNVGFGSGFSPRTVSQCSTGGSAIIHLCNNSAFFNSLRTVANDSRYWFYWAD